MHLPEGYGIAELNITEKFDEVGQSLSEAGFWEKDILVLSIIKKDRIITSPKVNDKIEVDDTLVCYGLLKNIKKYLPE